MTVAPASTVVSAPSALRAPGYAWCIVGAVVCNVLAGNSFRLGLPIGPDRVLMAAGLTLLLLDAEPWRRLRLRWQGVHVVMLLLVLLTVLSALAAGTLTTSYGLFALLDRLVIPFLLFCLAPVIFDNAAARRLLLAGLTALALYLGFTAIFEIVRPQALVFPRYIIDPLVGIQFGRARGPFIASEAMGLALFQTGLVAAYATTVYTGARRLLAAAAAGSCALGVFLTLTRSIWVGSVLGLILIGVKQPALRRRLPLIVVGIAATLAVAVAVVPGLQAQVSERAGTTRSVYDRQNTNAAALRIIEERPLTGVGWVRFIDVSRDYVRQADTYPVTNVEIEVHNVVLSRAAELGVLGAALWVLAVLMGPVRAALSRTRADLRGWQLAQLGGLVCWGVSVLLSPVPYPFPNLAVFLLAGLVLTPKLVAPRAGSRVPAAFEQG